ncbi:unnamed protein product [Arctia plantaginis]|uniref:Methyltransferase domain-containing protein n=1 Tax=Arctia plantaginis TaxID=874455 RepID=A0A8S1ASV2_ARCPL|nr:unnamed protein product [Arctia plantaginis]CAB3247935.1 unnamed protein product [Arctia plantaginis]
MHNAVAYNKSNIIHKREIPEYLEKYVPTLKWKKNSYRIMDIGSADGSVTTILQTFLPPASKILGCDISENMVKFATDNYSNGQTSFIVLDIAGDIPEDMKESFDHVFSFYTLNWVRDQQRAFENIFNVLEQNGECFMVLGAYNPIFDVYRTLAKDSKWSPFVYDVERYISPYHDSQEPGEEIAKLMENTGFVDVNVKCNDKCFLFDDENMRMSLLSALNPFEIPKYKIDEFRKDYNQLINNIESVHQVETNHSPEYATLHYKSIVIYGRKPLAS